MAAQQTGAASIPWLPFEFEGADPQGANPLEQDVNVWYQVGEVHAVHLGPNLTV